MIVGIDPGAKGGIALMTGCGCIAEAYPMPTNGKIVDIPALIEICPYITFACIEAVHAFPGQGVTSMFNFGKAYGMLLGWLETVEAKYIGVDPRKWKNTILAGTEKDKYAAIEFVKREYPMVDLTPGRKQTPHDGMADAVCIAKYAWITWNELTKT